MSEYALWQEEQDRRWREILELDKTESDRWAKKMLMHYNGEPLPDGDLEPDDGEEYRHHHEYDAHGKVNPDYIPLMNVDLDDGIYALRG